MEYKYCETKILTKTLEIDNPCDCIVKTIDSKRMFSSYLVIKCNMGVARVLKIGPFIEGVGLNDRFKLECYSTKPELCTKEISNFLSTVYNTKKDCLVEIANALTLEQLQDEIPTYLDVEQLLKDNLK